MSAKRDVFQLQKHHKNIKKWSDLQLKGMDMPSFGTVQGFLFIYAQQNVCVLRMKEMYILTSSIPAGVTAGP